MKKIFFTIFVICLFNLQIYSQENAGCRDFTQNSITSLNENEFLPDGKYNSVKLNPGDKIEVYKPFYKGREYMILVQADVSLPGISVELKDVTKNIIYNTTEIKSVQEILFTPDKNQNIIISVVVSKSANVDINVNACVSVVVGFK